MTAALARGRSSEVFAATPGRVVKLYFAGASEEEVDREVRDSMTVRDLEITPVRCYGRIELHGRLGILFDRIDGVPLTTLAERNILRLPEVGRTLAAEHATVHAATTHDLQDVRELAVAQLETPAFDTLSSTERDALVTHLRSLPAGDAVLHLDFHPQNVFVLAGRNVVIDWQTAAAGDPAADVALTRLLLREAELFPGTSLPMRIVYAAVRRILLRHYLAEYLRRTALTVADLDRWAIAARVLRLGLLDVASERDRMLSGIRRELAAMGGAPA
jgi:hypothetical protein